MPSMSCTDASCHCLQTAGMPVTQWEYNDALRQSCHPPPPPAEEWRIALHEKSAGTVRPVFAVHCPKTL